MITVNPIQSLQKVELKKKIKLIGKKIDIRFPKGIEVVY